MSERPGWDAWHPREVADRLAGVEVPWCVVAGWAIDLHRGDTTREHADTEIAVPAAGFSDVREALAGYDFDVVGSGRMWPLGHDAFDVMHQTWVRERTTGRYHLDVFREPHDGATWICRRDETIRRPYAEIIRITADGIPYLRPEIVLLFKAKHDRAKDEHDFAGVLPLLADAERRWLATALAPIHPAHRWLAALAE